jgi:hypothetical protein
MNAAPVWVGNESGQSVFFQNGCGNRRLPLGAKTRMIRPIGVHVTSFFAISSRNFRPFIVSQTTVVSKEIFSFFLLTTLLVPAILRRLMVLGTQPDRESFPCFF